MFVVSTRYIIHVDTEKLFIHPKLLALLQTEDHGFSEYQFNHSQDQKF